MTHLRLLIADDHQMFRAGIINLLKKEDDFKIAGEASDGAEVIRLAATLRPDIILMDIHLPEINGIDATRAILKDHSHLKVLALTSYEDEAHLVGMIKAGAKGYVLKEAPVDELVLAIKSVAKGSCYFAKEVFPKLFALLEDAGETNSSRKKARKLAITGREFEVLHHISEELTNKEIAAKLYISPRTVETHRRNLIHKLNVKNTAGLVKYYLNNLKNNNERHLSN